jgi:7-cyano-7-deazaguanine synthase in queuosine biosynthesis
MFKKTKRVLLWSGGLDSTAALILEEPDLVVHVIAGETGHHKIEREGTMLLKDLLEYEVGFEMPPLIYYDHQTEFWGYGESVFVPFRNFLYVMDAYNEALRYWTPANWPDVVEVWVVGVLGGYQSDKSPDAFQIMSNFLNDMLQASKFHDAQGVKFPKVQIRSPYWKVTKSMLIRRIEKKFPQHSEKIMKNIVTCFNMDESGEPCGLCPACWRYFVALTLGTGKDWVDWFAGDVMHSPAGEGYYARAKLRVYPQEKNKEHIRVWEACRNGKLETLLK